MNHKSLDLNPKTNKILRRSIYSKGQSTMEYVLVAAMITSSLAFYPMLMNAIGVYLKSMHVILSMAMP